MKKEDILGDLGVLPTIAKKGLINTEKTYLYRKDSVKEPLSLKIAGGLKDKIERHANKVGHPMNDIVEAILAKYYKDLDFDPISKEELAV